MQEMKNPIAMGRHWRINGANAQTGQDVAVELAAETRQQAEEAARRQGILVAEITPAPPLVPDYGGPATPRQPARAAGEPLDGFSTVGIWLQEWQLGSSGDQRGIVTLSVIAGICHLVGWISLAVQSGNYFGGSSPLTRFQADNAWGATANALEQMGRQAEAGQGMMLALLVIALGLLCQVVAHQIRNRMAMRRLGNLMASNGSTR